MKEDAWGNSEPDAVRRIVVEMLAAGFSPCVLVFINRTGVTRTFHREDLDVDAILRLALQERSSSDVCH